MEQNLTPAAALQILSTATEPQAQGRLTRQDYVNVNNSLALLQQFVAESYEKDRSLVLLQEEKEKSDQELELLRTALITTSEKAAALIAESQESETPPTLNQRTP